jgi:hypothetical protein
LFMDTLKRAEEIPQPRPNPFPRIAVHFAYAVPIIVSGILPLRVAHRVRSTPRFTQMVVG